MAEMKDSGIEWIGMIPKNWNADKIKYHLKRNEPKNPGNVEVLSVYREYGVIPKIVETIIIILRQRIHQNINM